MRIWVFGALRNTFTRQVHCMIQIQATETQNPNKYVTAMKISLPKNRKGQALVETALVLFIVVLFTFAITEFGRAMYIKNTLNNAARAGAREAVVTGSLALSTAYNFSTPPTDPIGLKIYKALMYVDKTQVTATVDCTACSGSFARNSDTITVRVTLHNFQPIVNIIKIIDTLNGEASMRYE